MLHVLETYELAKLGEHTKHLVGEQRRNDDQTGVAR